MADFDGVIDPPAGNPDVPQLSIDAVALGGVLGPMNAQAAALVARQKQAALDLADTTDPAKGAAMVGMFLPHEDAISETVREFLLRQPVFAQSFGFSPGNTAAQNGAALKLATQYANGKPVNIHSDSDYRLNGVGLDGTLDTIDIVFTGKGKVIHDDTDTGRVIDVITPFFGMQPVLSMESVVTTIQGIADSRVTAITLADISEYQKGDFVRIFSDDIDPDAREGYTARRGEVAYIIQTDPGSNTLYTAQRLEDDGLYTANVRIARYSRNKFSCKGLRIQSSAASAPVQALVNVSGYVTPDVDLDVRAVGQNITGIRFSACVHYRCRLVGGGNVNGISLNYGIVDDQSHGGLIYDSHGWGWRHFVTTSFTSAPEGSTSPYAYGASRDLLVINSRAWGCAFAPFDEHEGARRTKFVNCFAYCDSGGNDTQAYSLRGKDSEVINCYADQSFALAVRHNQGRGTHKVVNSRFECPLTEGFDGSGRTPDIIIYKDCSVRWSAMHQYGLIGRYLLRTNVIIDGGTYEITGAVDGTSNSNLFYLPRSNPGNAMTLEFVNDPLFIIAAQPVAFSTNFLIQSGLEDANGAVYGRVRIRNRSGKPLNTIISRSSSTNSLTADLEVLWLEGDYTAISNSTTSGFSYLRYRVVNRAVRPMTLTEFKGTYS